MWRNALVCTAFILLASFVGLMSQLDSLLPYRGVLAQRYLVPAAIFTVLYTINVFGLFFVLTRFLFLKDTGRKLAHTQKQLRAGHLVVDRGEHLMGHDQ